ncbi:YkyB family protein [Ectobacillus ponti]|uniref:YkyB family protein n=1 Tax=Ectobacillus ponti TaxID=2961894 RepID=A0AA41X8I9_9BACI|nr:YkyB family protein [Ectobacillus ponti]MCP8970874.1 YkyB family protein [Ectobacillus ponti]
MKQNSSHTKGGSPALEQLAQAVFVVNSHAKSAPDPKYLYWLKRRTLEKLIAEGQAKKEGLHFSRNPRLSKQQSDVLVKAGSYYFHLPPAKEDFQTLPHLGELNDTYRNPKPTLSLSAAKRLLQQYIGPEAMEEANKAKQTTPWYKQSTYMPNRRR